ncbi:hypothetical protein [Alicyclobacillus macrosporangiidus]|uniref:hypothetical protein n=1 Tax=Alicyclobacillus macrosporangiidus TaxID=392015 RepID=UPI001E49089D|nr:hypothetical protein [Alicyclobacillus macrosporangiidus]
MSTTVHAVSVRKGVNIEIASVIWMIVEAGVAIGAGVIAHSLALVAFGADSIIELIAGVVLLWRLAIEVNGASMKRVERAEKVSTWVVGVAFWGWCKPKPSEKRVGLRVQKFGGVGVRGPT